LGSFTFKSFKMIRWPGISEDLVRLQERCEKWEIIDPNLALLDKFLYHLFVTDGDDRTKNKRQNRLRKLAGSDANLQKLCKRYKLNIDTIRIIFIKIVQGLEIDPKDFAAKDSFQTDVLKLKAGIDNLPEPKLMKSVIKSVNIKLSDGRQIILKDESVLTNLYIKVYEPLKQSLFEMSHDRWMQKNLLEIQRQKQGKAKGRKGEIAVLEETIFTILKRSYPLLQQKEIGIVIYELFCLCKGIKPSSKFNAKGFYDKVDKRIKRQKTFQ
jgi:hypothetical protein